MRNKQTLLAGAGGLCAGLFYGYVLIPLGFRLVCPFRLLTGLRCAGCGITDLCLGILHGHFAPHHNWGLVLTAPAILWLAHAHWTLRQKRGVGIVTWAVLLFLLGWTIFRNIYHL